MCHFPKVEDGIENILKKLLYPYFQTILLKELWTAINPKPLKLFDLNSMLRTTLSADIISHKASNKLPYESALYLTCTRFLFNQLLLVMLCSGEPLSTTVKVVTAQML